MTDNAVALAKTELTAAYAAASAAAKDPDVTPAHWHAIWERLTTAELVYQAAILTTPPTRVEDVFSLNRTLDAAHTATHPDHNRAALNQAVQGLL
jgi:hypothetical protein